VTTQLARGQRHARTAVAHAAAQEKGLSGASSAASNRVGARLACTCSALVGQARSIRRYAEHRLHVALFGAREAGGRPLRAERIVSEQLGPPFEVGGGVDGALDGT
jgi:hypothetical protein